MARLLLVEDDERVRRARARVLVSDGHDVEEATTARRARELFRASHFERAVLDVNLPDGDGLELLAWLRRRRITTSVLVLTGVSDPVLSERAYLLGAPLVRKPAQAEVLRRLARGAGGVLEVTRGFAAEHELSPRQTDLLIALARGTPRASLPAALSVQESTVKTMVRQILEKTDAGSVGELVCRVLARTTEPMA